MTPESQTVVVGHGELVKYFCPIKLLLPGFGCGKPVTETSLY